MLKVENYSNDNRYGLGSIILFKQKSVIEENTNLSSNE